LHGNLFVDAGGVDGDEIDRLVDDAYDDNLAQGRVVTPAFADDVATGALKNQLDHMTEGVTTEYGNEILDDIALEEMLRGEFESTKEMLGRELSPVAMPSPEDFMAAGIDLKAIMEEFAEMDAKDMGPMLVISQINMSGPRWKQIFTSLTKDKSIPNNPLQEHTNYRVGHSHGLIIPSFPNDHVWQEIRQDAKQQILHGPQAVPSLNVIQDPDNPSFDIPWTIRVLPTSNDALYRRPHPTIDEYLTMQARLVQEGDGVLMGRYRLAGIARNSTTLYSQPFGEWKSASGVVEISMTRISR
jgi:hypothetical protein